MSVSAMPRAAAAISLQPEKEASTEDGAELMGSGERKSEA